MRPATTTCLVEISLVGIRDMQPREVMGVPIELAAPYVEFEYGDLEAEERLWKTQPVDAGKGAPPAVRSGPNVNFLEVMYLTVELPEDKVFEPMMGVRVREASRTIPFLGEDPILGISAINLLLEMPTYQQQLAEEKKVRWR